MRSLRRCDVRALIGGLVLGYAADQAIGDPRRWHPVAGFGRLATALEHRTYRDDRLAGVLHVGLLVGAAVGAGAAASAVTTGRPVLRTVLTGAATWIVLGGRSLNREAGAVHRLLQDGDLDGARKQITHLVGRDPAELSADELARACVESVAENTSDAVVAPLVWGGVAGLPGLLGYRAINTLDAMIGHRSDRYRRFGWAAARLDDVANWLPARLAGGLTMLSAVLVGGRPGNALTAIRTQAGQHPSPNAGVVEAAFAGALGVTIGGANRYHGVVEDRGELGTGRPADQRDIPRSTSLSALVGGAALAAAVGMSAGHGRWRRPRSRS
ncbi:cobalamin biosynthesis protein [Microlunatus soli]|uniref:Cobalamin biosynthesis protein CobD n=1 Tax=Microlunatus soli TaxID=630515 RepID=A0A1H1ZGZ1_9ACTN|nr:cobalamin biosynthesis protein [Microlunatus soli]SDT32954.1 adenosylcobinamide-phosphate synthase [Microlunatus soli]